VNRDDIKAVLAQGLEYGRDFGRQHRHVARDGRIVVCAGERRPVLSPIRELMGAPISISLRSSRPTVIL
jgi:hypothetical protein